MTNSPLRFAGQQSYAIQQDTVHLQAELAADAPLPAAPLSLQLRATRTDDPAVGITLAELPVPAASAALPGLIPVHGDAPLALPAGRFTHVIDLVLVEYGPAGIVEHDRIRFPNPTAFDLPQITGPAILAAGGDAMTISVPGVFNPRPAGSLSGSLSLSVWALPQPYQGGAFSGVLLGRQALGQLPGLEALGEQAMTAVLPQGLAGDWVLTLMLREWTAAGDLTRDFETLPDRIPLTPAATAETALPVTAEDAPVKVSATAPEKAKAKTPGKPKVGATTVGVSINTADVETLAAVKGMSAKLAAAIVAGRPYATLAEVLRVKGMGEKLLAKIGGGLTL